MHSKTSIQILIHMSLAMQASFVVEEWVDHALSKTREAKKKKLELSEKAHTNTEKRLKDTLFHLADVEKVRKNAKLALTGFERQAEEAQISLKEAEMQLALATEKTKQ